MLTDLDALAARGYCTKAYAAQILFIVDDWQRRRGLLKAGGATGDAQFHAVRLLMVISLKQGWSFDALIGGHVRTRKRMHALARYLLVGGSDTWLDNITLPAAVAHDQGPEHLTPAFLE